MSADKQYDRQFLAWALDRALRFYEVNKTSCGPDDVMKLAEQFCNWIQPAPDAEPTLPEPTVDEQAANAEHDKHVNGETVQ